MRTLRMARVAGALLLMAGAGMFAGGCRSKPQAFTVRERPEVMDASRTELLTILQDNALQLHSLRAKTQVHLTKQDVLLPAILSGKKLRGKMFAQGQINGGLLLARQPEGGRDMRFSGEIVGPSANFMLLGRNDAFWVIMPNMDRSMAGGKSPSRGSIFIGMAERQAVRPPELFSMRPQDLWDLFLPEECVLALRGGLVSFMETWPQYYVITFLEPQNWPNMIFSKIWIDRRDLTMSIHQIYDGAGEIIAEARFDEWRKVEVKGQPTGPKPPPVTLPQFVTLIWPRDDLVMQVELSNIQANVEIAPKWFEIDQIDTKGYEVRTINLSTRPREDRGELPKP